MSPSPSLMLFLVSLGLAVISAFVSLLEYFVVVSRSVHITFKVLGFLSLVLLLVGLALWLVWE